MYTPRIGDMFTDDNTHHLTWLLVTTNATVRRDGALVMGRGAAKTLATRFPVLPYTFGSRILAYQHKPYGVILDDATRTGIFQVKYHWANDANLTLILKSVDTLTKIAASTPDETYYLNYPGIGNGRLAKSEVEPLLADLPSNVHIWTFR